MSNKADKLLTKVLQGLRQMCNHCQLKDCNYCWSHDVCSQIINYFDTKNNKNVKKDVKMLKKQ